MNIKKEKEYIVKILTKILETNISIMYMYKETANDEKSKSICNKSINQCRKGIKLLPKIEHIEILRSLMEKIVYGKEHYFATSGALCSFSKIITWDTTKKGFQEFTKLEEEERLLRQKDFEEQQKQKELIKKAQEQGKNVEMVYDPTTKKIKPVVLEEKTNA